MASLPVALRRRSDILCRTMAARRYPPDDFRNADIQPIVAAFNRLDPRTQRKLLIFAVIAVVIAAIGFFFWQRHQTQIASQGQQDRRTTDDTAGRTTSAPPTPPAEAGEDLLLGNPSEANADAANRDNYLLVKPYFTLSYNNAKGTPNWVSWRVVAGDLGDAKRKLQFDTDTTLPAGFKQITHRDYTGSPFDRGHMCPHSDRAVDEAHSFATFIMTNIIPQSPNVNQKAWAELEMYGRDLVRKQGMRLYVISGPNGQGGRGKFGDVVDTIANGKVVVPAECWKIIVAVPETGQAGSPAQFTADARVIAVIMPNDNDQVRTDAWAQFRTSPAEVERRTGYHFFTALPPDIAEALRQKVDHVSIAPPKPHTYGGGGE